MSHAERHPGINRTLAPERPTQAAPRPEATGGSTTGNLDPNDPNFFKKHWKKLAAGATVLLAAGGIAYGVTTGIKGEAPAQPGPVPAEPGEQPGANPENPEQPQVGGPELIVPLSELADMSPEQITELTTISRESVTVDGKIDWGQVVNRYYDIVNLQVNAGATQAELDQVFSEGIPLNEYATNKYDVPMEAGYAQEGEVFEGTRAIHYNTLAIADLQSIRQGEVTVYTNYAVINFEIVDENQENGTAIIRTTYTLTDNFFSSGTLEEGDKLIDQLGRTEDLNVTRTEEMFVDFNDGSLNVNSSRLVS